MPDFSFTEEQEKVRQIARDFANKEIKPKIREIEEKRKVPEDLLKKTFEKFSAFLIPDEYVKVEYEKSHIARTIALEELGAVCPGLAHSLQVHHMCPYAILHWGTEEQKERFVPDLATGKKIGVLALTEPYGGSDPMGIRTTARKEGDEYILNGIKVWITNSHIADVIGVVAKIENQPKSLTYFLVEKDMDGFELLYEHKEMGLRGCNVGAFVLRDCRVPKENVLGKEGDGLRIALHSISNVGRPGVASICLGIIRRCLEISSAFAKRRKLYGKPISELQAIQFYLAEMYADYEAVKWVTYYSAWLRDNNVKCDAENALAKYLAVESAVKCARRAVDIFGAWGLAEENEPQRLLRDALTFAFCAGSQEIMKVIMARKALS